jgi:hypothetical protein
VFGEYFQGKLFEECIGLIYKELGVLPMAMTNISVEGSLSILVNPCGRVIQSGDLVYVLATTLAKAASIATYSPEKSGCVSRSLPISDQGDTPAIPAVDMSRQILSQRTKTEIMVTKQDIKSAFHMKICCPNQLAARAIHFPAISSDGPENNKISSAQVQFQNHVVVGGFVEKQIYEFIWTLRNQVGAVNCRKSFLHPDLLISGTHTRCACCCSDPR